MELRRYVVRPATQLGFAQWLTTAAAMNIMLSFRLSKSWADNRRDHVSAQVGNSLASRRDPGIAAVLGFIWPGVGYLYAGRGPRGLLLLLLFPVAELSIYLLAVLVPVPVM